MIIRLASDDYEKFGQRIEGETGSPRNLGKLVVRI